MLAGAVLDTVVPGPKVTVGNEHDMTGAYLVRPLALNQIPQALPLVSMLDAAPTMAQWQDDAGAMIRSTGDRNGRQADVSVAGGPVTDGPGVPGGPRDDHHMLSVQSAQGHIDGDSTYRLRPDLRRERVMETENFAVDNVTGTRRGPCSTAWKLWPGSRIAAASSSARSIRWSGGACATSTRLLEE